MICFFFFNDTATTEIYTLSLHDALPISESHDMYKWMTVGAELETLKQTTQRVHLTFDGDARSEEHTSELQSHSFISYAVFCLKKKKKNKNHKLTYYISA